MMLVTSHYIYLLIQIISVVSQSIMKVYIHNQCSNVDLVSPTYINGDGLKCYRPPDYKVCTGDTMRLGFIIKSDSMSYGALIYKLQRRQSHESTEICEDASSATQLLVVWESSKFEGSHVNVLLVEYEKRFSWNEDELGNLYNKNRSWFKKYSGTISDTWFLDDNMTLKTTFRVVGLKGIHELIISISEIEGDGYAMRPLRLNIER
jgi:hypothetical protein